MEGVVRPSLRLAIVIPSAVGCGACAWATGVFTALERTKQRWCEATDAVKQEKGHSHKILSLSEPFE